VTIQRPATVALRSSLYEDATQIVAHEYQEELSLDDIARRSHRAVGGSLAA
jgi:AraC family transcriptional regulator, regulatory protein of adaptative response / methylphosphotriester-DNA alkyltransferase methyltransferase